jgi:hypothetical protein
MTMRKIIKNILSEIFSYRKTILNARAEGQKLINIIR